MVTAGELAPLPVSNVDILGVSEPNGQSEIMSGHRDAPLAWLAHEMGLLAFVKPVVITPWLDSDESGSTKSFRSTKVCTPPDSRPRIEPFGSAQERTLMPLSVLCHQGRARTDQADQLLSWSRHTPRRFS